MILWSSRKSVGVDVEKLCVVKAAFCVWCYCLYSLCKSSLPWVTIRVHCLSAQKLQKIKLLSNNKWCERAMFSAWKKCQKWRSAFLICFCGNWLTTVFLLWEGLCLRQMCKINDDFFFLLLKLLLFVLALWAGGCVAPLEQCHRVILCAGEMSGIHPFCVVQVLHLFFLCVGLCECWLWNTCCEHTLETTLLSSWSSYDCIV